MKYHTVPISATGKVPSTAKAGCPVWQNTTCGNVQKEQAVKVSEIREEIMPENRPMYQRQNEEYIQGG